MKKCPPGVICVENVTLLLLFIILLVSVSFVYSNSNGKVVTINNDITSKETSSGWLNNLLPSWPYNNLPRDVLLDPYAAPYRDERYLVPIRNTVPINVSTNIGSVDTTYRQMGIITPLNGASKDNILSLMGRPLFTNRDKWQYYTISNQHNEGYNEAFRVTVYENDTIKYLPFV